MSPIFNLPNEIIEIIFLLNAKDEITWIWKRSSTTLASSQVCQKWRMIALQYSALWPPIINYSSDSIELIQELVRRSGTELLDFGNRQKCIKFAFNRPYLLNTSCVLTCILDHTSRLRSFHFEVLDPSWWRVICDRFLRHPAPNLEFFGITTVKKKRKFSGTLFANQAPLLRSVQLDMESWAPDFSKLSSFLLTDLCVEAGGPHCFSWGLSPLVEDWLSFLSNMPSLRCIIILDALGIQLDPDNAPLPNVHLPNLEFLHVRGLLHKAVTLIDHLSVPPQCGLSLQCTDAKLYPGDECTLHAVIDKKLMYWEKSPFPNCFLAARHVESWAFIGNHDLGDELWDTIGDLKLFTVPSEPVFSICLISEDPPAKATLFILLFSLLTPIFPAITGLKLWLEVVDDTHIEAFQSLASDFQHFQNLTTLTLARDSHIYLFPLLEITSERAPVLLPTLQLVQFVKASFCTGSISQIRTATFFQWRKEKGYPILRVEMNKCSLNKSFIHSSLKEVQVDMVHRD